MNHPYHRLQDTPLWHEVSSAIAALEQNQDLKLTTNREHVIGFLCQQLRTKHIVKQVALLVTDRELTANDLADAFLELVEARRHTRAARKPLGEYKTSKGIVSNGEDICGTYFNLFSGCKKTEIYAAALEILRRKGDDCFVQNLTGVMLLNLVPDTYGQVDGLIDIVAPVFDVSGAEIAAFLVEQIGLEALLRKIETRKLNSTKDLVFRLDGMAYQARGYQSGKQQ